MVELVSTKTKCIHESTVAVVLSPAAVLHQSHRRLLRFYKPPNYVTQSNNGYNVGDLPTCEENGILRRQKLYV